MPQFLSFIVLLIISYVPSLAQEEIVYDFREEKSGEYIGKYLYVLSDTTSELKTVLDKPFQKSNEEVPNLGIGQSAWMTFKVLNGSSEENLLLVLESTDISLIELYEKGQKIKLLQTSGVNFPFVSRKYPNQNFVFDLSIPSGSIKEYYIRVSTAQALVVPLTISTPDKAFEHFQEQTFWFGIFAGALLLVIIYNGFLYLAIKEKIYLYYILYIFLIGFTQMGVLGYWERFLFHNFPGLLNKGIIVFVAFSGIAAVLFFNSILPFLKYFKWYRILIRFFYFISIVCILITLLGYTTLGFIFVNFISFTFSIGYFLIFLFHAIKGNIQARFLFAGWLITLIGFSIYVLRNAGVLPFNFITNSTMQIGVVIESFIFSFALAYRINNLSQENENNKEQVIIQLQEKEKNIRAVKDAEVMVEELKKETMLSQFEALKSQVNPHFLFNSLNVLLELIHQNQSKAVEFVKELSDVYHYVLDNRKKQLVDLNTELKFIESFIYLLKIRYSDNLKVLIKVNSSSQFGLPPLALQLLIENCIKHNVISREEPLEIEILEREGFIAVRNKLQRKNAVLPSSGIGLSNLSLRYAYLSDQKIQISETENIFQVMIPLVPIKKI